MVPQLSIIVPVYNPGEYLPRALGCIAAQTRAASMPALRAAEAPAFFW